MEDDDSAEIRAAVQMAVIEVCSTNDTTVRLTPQAIATVAELTLQFVRCSLAPNLQAFSNHASRRRITEHDVLLTLRNHREFHRKVQQRIDHFKRTNDLLAAPDTAAAARAKISKPEQVADDTTSSNSSCTDSEAPEPVAKPPAKRLPSSRPMFDEFSSSDDELHAIRAKLTRKRPKEPALLEDHTAKKAVAPKRATFRLTNAGTGSKCLRDNIEDSLFTTSPLPGIIQTQSKRLQEILLANQDDESLPSECD